jgi:hypothetical protein
MIMVTLRNSLQHRRSQTRCRRPPVAPHGQGRGPCNLIQRLRAGEPLFSGVVGFDDTVIPQLVNAILSKHNFILLGLRARPRRGCCGAS